MDLGDWQQALQVCMVIVGHTETVGAVQPQYNDSCAASTMEDIAKVYDNLEDPESSIAWLKKAVKCEWNLWKDCVATKHVVDKLVAALLLRGRRDEAIIWRDRYLNGE